MITIHVHRMRVDARTRNRTVWLDIGPREPSSGLPNLTVFLEPEDVDVLRRQLDDVSVALNETGEAAHAASGEALALVTADEAP